MSEASAAPRLLRRAAARAAWATGLTSLLARARRWDSPCIALLFHRVLGSGAPAGRIPMGEILAPDLLARLEWLRRHADVLDAESWIEERESASRRGRPRVLVTFDDGYRDFATLAAPACTSLGIRPLLFISAGFLDNRAARPWWDWPYRSEESPDEAPADLARWSELAFADPERASEIVAAEAVSRGWRPPSPGTPNEFCDWAELRALRDRADFGAHGVFHLPFSRLPAARLADELEGAARRIEDGIGARPSLLAYPYGDERSVSPSVRAAARSAGYRAAFRAGGPADARGEDPFALPRVVFSPGPVWRFAAHWARLPARP